MLKNLRITLAALFIVGITLVLAGIGVEWLGWMPSLQFLPSCLALNLGVIAGIVALTLIFGRIYCSIICPLGVFQDLVIWLRRHIGLWLNKLGLKRLQRAKAAGETDVPKLKPYVKHFSFNKERRWIRYPLLAAFIVCLISGTQVVIALLAPYSAYGRMVSAAVGGHTGAALAAVAGVTFIVIVLCAWFWGRAYCNNVCPVGTTLSLLARASVLKIKIDETKCSACGRCGRGCKASCIDMENHKVDYSRCVVCFDCIGRCREGAISYRLACCGKKKAVQTEATEPAAPQGADPARRAFLAGAVIAAGSLTLRAQEQKADGGLAAIEQKKAPVRTGVILPPGARDEKHFFSHCTACQLCVQACPNDVLRPSTDLKHFMQPVMGYERGYCRPECTECSQLCPSGAILPLIPEAKTGVHIGRAHVDHSLCVAARGEAECGNCARHCPAQAIRMVNSRHGGKGYKVPVVVEEKCIGCGACEYLCPSRPYSAIHVDGLSEHCID